MGVLDCGTLSILCVDCMVCATHVTLTDKQTTAIHEVELCSLLSSRAFGLRRLLNR